MKETDHPQQKTPRIQQKQSLAYPWYRNSMPQKKYYIANPNSQTINTDPEKGKKDHSISLKHLFNRDKRPLANIQLGSVVPKHYVNKEPVMNLTKKRAFLANLKLNKTYKYPSNVQVARCHQESNKLGKKSINRMLQASSDVQNVKKKLKICPCCDSMMVAEQFPICYPTWLKSAKMGAQKNQLPIGLIMYFVFIKMMIAFLILRFLLFDIYTLMVSVTGNYCANLLASGSSKYCVIVMSAYNLKAAKDQAKLNIIDYVSLGYVVLSILFFIIFRKIVIKQQDRYITFPFFQDSYYSILIQNVAPFIWKEDTNSNEVSYQYEKQLQKILKSKIQIWLKQLEEKRGQRKKLSNLDLECIENVIDQSQFNIQELAERSIAAISICYDLTQFENIEAMRKQLLEEYTSTQAASIQDGQTFLLKHIPNQIKHLNQEYVKLCQYYVDDQTQVSGFKLTHFTGKAFISFQYQHYRDYFIRQFDRDTNFLTISGKPIRISYANRPNDVYWNNMKVKDEERNKNIFHSWSVLLMLLILSFAALFGIQQWQKSQQLHTNIILSLYNKVMYYLIMGIQSFITFVINQILSYAMDLLSVMQKHKTKTDRMKSLTIKVIVTQTINTCLIYGVLYVMNSFNTLGSLGLVNKVVNLAVVSGVINLLLCVFPIGKMISYLSNRKMVREKEQINMFQVELNRRFEDPEYDFPSAYAYYIIQLFLVAFYGYIAPVLTPILIALFFLQYWIDKYNIFRRFSYPVDYSFQLTQMMITIFEISIVFYSISHFVWDLTIHYDASQKFKLINIGSIVLSSVYVGLFGFSTESFRKKILMSYNKPDIFSYSDYMEFQTNKFAKTFFTQNPATSCFGGLDNSLHFMNEDAISRQKFSANEPGLIDAKKNQKETAGTSILEEKETYEPAYRRKKINPNEWLQKISEKQKSLLQYLSALRQEGRYIEAEVEKLKHLQHKLEEKIKRKQNRVEDKDQSSLSQRKEQESQQYYRDIAERNTVVYEVEARVLTKKQVEKEAMLIQKELEELRAQRERIRDKIRIKKELLQKQSRQLKSGEGQGKLNKNQLKQAWIQNEQQILESHSLKSIPEELFFDEDELQDSFYQQTPVMDNMQKFTNYDILRTQQLRPAK